MAEKSARSKEVENELTLEQVKDQLTVLGKKTGVLAYDDIAEKIAKFELDSDQMDEFYEFLGDQGIELVGESDEMMIQAPKKLAKEDEEEFDLNDLSVPPGVKINDPVRMYLKEIGRVNLLSAEDEIKLANELKRR